MIIVLNIIQIVLSVLIVAVVLLQNNSASASTLFGGSSSINQTRRGSEKFMHRFTIVLIVSFSILSFARAILT